MPQPIFKFGISADGQHYVVALADGSLIIKSKELEDFEEEVKGLCDGLTSATMNLYFGIAKELVSICAHVCARAGHPPNLVRLLVRSCGPAGSAI